MAMAHDAAVSRPASAEAMDSDGQHGEVQDVGAALDAGPWTGFQRRVVAMLVVAVAFDGFDNQILAYAMPLMLEEWGLTRAQFAPLIALGLLGIAAGTAVGGLLGDRFGRRPLVVGSVAWFGACTLLTPLMESFYGLAALRVLATLGLGALIPNAAALSAEYSPAFRRSLAVSLSMVAVPIGGLVVGALATSILPNLGWRWLFGIGGALPLLYALGLYFWLPESPRLLTRVPGRRTELLDVLSRSGVVVTERAVFVDCTVDSSERSGFRSLLGPIYRRDTLALWLAFTASLFSVYMVFNWAPTAMRGLGLSIAAASSALAAFNLGSIAGALVGAVMIDRYGSRWPMLGLAAGGIACGALMGIALDAGVRDTGSIVLGFTAAGFLVSGVQVALFTLAAFIYPPALRSTGTGAALALGRGGAILGGASGAIILDLSSGALLYAVAFGSIVSVIGLALVNRHSKPRHRFSN